MTRKQLINQLCYEYNTINYNEQKLKRMQEIKKDWEVLNILKKHIYSSDSSISIILDDLRNYDDFIKIKEWLKNDK